MRGIYRDRVSLCPWAIILVCPGTFSQMPTFDIHCRYALVTYAQCGDLSPDSVGEFFEGLGFKCVIGRENHADGGIHLHCFVDFGRKRRFRRPRCFDTGGRHPNVEPSRGTPEKGWDYAVKDGDVVYKSLDRPGRAEEAMAELVISGLRSRVRAIESRFGIWSMNWIQRAQHVLSPNFKSTATGNLLLCLPSMLHQTESVSPAEMLTEEMIGYNNLVLEVEMHS